MEDPRIARTRAAVMDTAAELVVNGGPSALTVDAVVARSGVAKSTIYRHWPTRDQLLLDVFEFCSPKFQPPPPELGFVEALRYFLHEVVEQMSDPKWARMLPALLMLKAYEASMADIEHHLAAEQEEILADLVARGEREGLLPEPFRRDHFVAQLVGPLVFAHLTGLAELSDELADSTIDLFVRSLPPAPAPAAGSRPASRSRRAAGSAR